MDERNNYIDWLFNLETVLRTFNIEYSDYDEFHVNEAIKETERIIKEQELHTEENSLTETMIDAYMKNAIKNEPSKKDYYETISYYVKRRLLHH